MSCVAEPKATASAHHTTGSRLARVGQGHAHQPRHDGALRQQQPAAPPPQPARQQRNGQPVHQRRPDPLEGIRQAHPAQVADGGAVDARLAQPKAQRAQHQQQRQPGRKTQRQHAQTGGLEIHPHGFAPAVVRAACGATDGEESGRGVMVWVEDGRRRSDGFFSHRMCFTIIHRSPHDHSVRPGRPPGIPRRRGAVAGGRRCVAAPALAQVDVGKTSGFRKLVPAETLENSARQEYAQVLAEARAKDRARPAQQSAGAAPAPHRQRLIPQRVRGTTLAPAGAGR